MAENSIPKLVKITQFGEYALGEIEMRIHKARGGSPFLDLNLKTKTISSFCLVKVWTELPSRDNILTQLPTKRYPRLQPQSIGTDVRGISTGTSHHTCPPVRFQNINLLGRTCIAARRLPAIGSSQTFPYCTVREKRQTIPA